MESSRKRGRSDMWGHFKLIALDKCVSPYLVLKKKVQKVKCNNGEWNTEMRFIHLDAVQCLLCLGVYKYHGNTSSMIRHFSTQHRAVVNQGNANQVDQKQDQKEDPKQDKKEDPKQDQKQYQKQDQKEDQKQDQKQYQKQDQKEDQKQDQKQYQKQDEKQYQKQDQKQYQKQDEKQYQKQDQKQYQKQDQKEDQKQDQKQYQKQDQKQDEEQYQKQVQKQDPDEALVKMVVKESQPLSIVDSLLLNDSVEQPRKRGRSDMWEHFNLIRPDKVQCSVCLAELKYHGNTSSMIRHYTTKHRAAFNQRKKNKDDRKRELDEALVNMLVKDSQPFSIVDDRGFKEFVALLDPTYTLPSPQTLEDMVIKRFNEQKTKVKDDVGGGHSDPKC